MFQDEYVKIRMGKTESLNELGINPFTHGESIKKTDRIIDVRNSYENEIVAEDKLRDNKVIIAGRIIRIRGKGNVSFIELQDENSSIQIFLRKNDLEDTFVLFKKSIVDIGDIIKISGFPFKTKTGEFSIYAEEVTFLTKSYLPLPDKWNGIKDKELIYRKRHLDMIMNQKTRDTFKLRSRIVSSTRRFFEDLDFMEVETPMMNNIPGGANARPFITHHNALGIDRFMRIAPELYLKRLVVGGFEKVFEIGKNFRNEGIDHTHNPEFTSIEAYWAYEDYNTMMDTIENLILKIMSDSNIPNIIEYQGIEINMGEKFDRITYRDSLIEIGNVPNNILDDKFLMIDYLKEHNMSIKVGLNKGKLWEKLFDEFVEKKLINPTYIIDYPTEISPLSRQKVEDKTVSERFELFIAGREIANGFNELNDPVEQYQRFLEQVENKGTDDEAMHMDKDFVDALMTGLPPTVGVGLGIDRLVMLLTNSSSIKDVILFPAMKELE